MIRVLAFACLACLTATPAVAQEVRALHQEQVSDEHRRFTGLVEFSHEGTKISADAVDWYLGRRRIAAEGNVVFASGDGSIAAARAEYDLETGTGWFETAAGILHLGAGLDHARQGHQDTELLFHAERIEKVGARKYRLTKGAFSTCLQPVPRWRLTTRTVTLELDRHAVAEHMTFRVKGVPILYLPIFYYPLDEDDRATGFLMPSYGSSTLRGSAISNAFFWAIGRSHDATVFHDWFTRAGHGLGAEYRWAARAGSAGTARVYRLGQPANGALPAGTSYQVSGNATHTVAPGIVARGRVDYFTDILRQQVHQQDVYQASRVTRTVEGGLSAFRGPLSGSVIYQRIESLPAAGTSVTYGSTPRISGQVAPQRLFNSPVYASLAAEYAYLPFTHVQDGALVRDTSLHRVDLAPAVRLGLSRLTYLSVNTTASFRTTYYSRGAAPSGAASEASYVRRYATAGAEIIGPVLERLWDAPDGNAGGRLKHVVEPVVGVDYTSRIEGLTPLLGDLSDIIVGGSVRITYGLNNRLFRSGASRDGARGASREIATIGIQQTYYSNPEASLFDTRYMSVHGSGRPRDLSPVALHARLSPARVVDATARLEYDVTAGRGLQAITAGATASARESSLHLNYSRRRVQWFLPADDFLSASATTRLLQGRVSGAYALHWDLGRAYLVSQRIGGTYLAQCCGFQVEYQAYRLPPGYGLSVPADRRINLSIILAGLGSFSNFFGAFGLLQ